MALLPIPVIYHGVEQMTRPSYELKAGPLTMLYDNGDLRYIRLGQHEILRRVYATVRDHNWGTVIPQVNNETLHIHNNWFRIGYEAVHRLGDVDFMWEVEIKGSRDGTVVFTIEGEARAAFRTNRTGFCVLHPMEVAGKACTVEYVDGTREESHFPERISPHQPFKNLRAIIHEVAPGISAEVRMEGDIFEMEDQRNWTDASFKTYCRPLELPYPFVLDKDARISQTVTIRLLGDAAAVEEIAMQDSPQGALILRVSDDSVPLPELGLGVSPFRLNDLEASRLRLLNLTHLRVDWKLWQADLADDVRQAISQASALGVPLEVALFVSDKAQTELVMFRSLLAALRPNVARWIVLHRSESSTSAHWVNLARENLQDYARGVPVGAGTNGNFTELNRNRPPVEAIDFAAYSINPQVHAFADVDLVENLAPQMQTVTNTRAFIDNKPVYVTPVTLRRRWNPVATGDAVAHEPRSLPPEVDPRQMSLFGAGWTLGSIKYLAQGGAAGITYYQTSGWQGVMERVEGSPMPLRFRSLANSVFPMFHVFADLADFVGGEVIPCFSSDPLSADGLIVRKGERVRVLLANFTPSVQIVRLEGLRTPGTPVSVLVKSLDENNAQDAMANPEGWRAMPGVRVEFGATWQHALKPYSVVRVDVE